MTLPMPGTAVAGNLATTGQTDRSAGRTIGELSAPVPQVDAADAVSLVERIFREHPQLRAVAVVGLEGPPALLSRSSLERQLSGRLGYGRALLSRAVAGDVVDAHSLRVDADLPLRDAAGMLLAQREWLRDDDVLVLHQDGTTGVASVAAIFREIGLVYQEIAMRDPLTGLPNRRMLDEHGTRLLATGTDPARVAVLYADLDGFKQVNDTLGHKAGDELLVAFARRLDGCVRPQDLIGRLGGDEFAVLLTDIDPEEATAVADRVVVAAQEKFTVEDHRVEVSASVGIALGSELTGDEPVYGVLDELLERADRAMFRAKRAGKSRVARWLRVEEAGAPGRRATLRRRLEHAIAHGDLHLHFQPKLDLRTGRVESVEALLRWTDEELGVISPGEAIPVAEVTGQIVALGEWVLRAACAQARAWQDAGRDWAVAVNVSPVQLAEPGLPEQVLAALEEAGIPPRLLQVEVTETAAIADLPLAIEQLHRLQEAGVSVHLDDFGVGYSSLGRMRSLPVSTLKIDQSIVSRIDSDEADAQLLSGVIKAAHTMGLTVVAEGVERTSQLDRLRELGCDVAQGYLISRPRPAGELETAP
ncbi:putative bifunctional diguanylate cyclase/phosphodiesterase [Xylanimonas oleitrophica]|uniref:putative bifunctional diguanylate cyclase/phosphodiesterase n=1 Tax=Xylanimonas oleitrophica TaxID=2607479 RepID=UPI0011B83141|nr:EAL domain-containing protein [Xylanimonas oleitrophica]